MRRRVGCSPGTAPPNFHEAGYTTPGDTTTTEPLRNRRGPLVRSRYLSGSDTTPQPQPRTFSSNIRCGLADLVERNDDLEEELRRSIDENDQGLDNNPMTYARMHDLAVLLSRRGLEGDVREAELFFVRAQQGQERLLGVDHATTHRTRCNLELLQAQGEHMDSFDRFLSFQTSTSAGCRTPSGRWTSNSENRTSFDDSSELGDLLPVPMSYSEIEALCSHDSSHPVDMGLPELSCHPETMVPTASLLASALDLARPLVLRQPPAGSFMAPLCSQKPLLCRPLPSPIVIADSSQDIVSCSPVGPLPYARTPQRRLRPRD